MGIIQRQSIQSTFANYVGVAFGTATRLMMPFVITPLQIGLLGLIDTISGTFTILFNFGVNLILKRLFPQYRDEENGHHGFLVFGLLISLFGAVLAIGTYYLIEDWVLYSNEENQELARYAYLIPPVILFRIIFLNVDGYVKMLFNTVIGTVLDSLISKIFLFIGLLLMTLAVINYDVLMYIYAFVLAMPGMVIIFVALKKTKKLTWPKSDLLSNRKKIRTYMFFGVLTGASGSIVQYTDSWMIHDMISDDKLGIYLIMFFASSLILIPAKGVKKIAAVVIAESWNRNDRDNIQLVYQKSCVNLLLIGSYIFLVGWACIDPVLEYLPDYTEGKYVFFWLGLGKVVELGTGVNADIIETSERYKFNAYFSGILAICVIGFNLIFIEQLGIVGAGLASFLAMALINALRFLLIKYKFGFQAFNTDFYKSLVLALVFLAIVTFVQYELHPIAKLLINAFVVTAVFWWIAIKLNLSKDINEWLKKIRLRYLG